MAPDTQINRRRLTIKAMTDAGWVAGTLHIPSAVRLVDYMERAPGFLPLSNVFMQAHTKRIPFFALQQHAIEFMAIEGDEDPSSAEDTQIMEDHSVSCLLTKGILRGKIAVKPGFRLSDYLAKHHHFIPLRSCTFQVRAPNSQSTVDEHAAFILLNPARVIGFSERSDQAGVGEAQ